MYTDTQIADDINSLDLVVRLLVVETSQLHLLARTGNIGLICLKSSLQVTLQIAPNKRCDPLVAGDATRV
jgi:hypothetical protein